MPPASAEPERAHRLQGHDPASHHTKAPLRPQLTTLAVVMAPPRLPARCAPSSCLQDIKRSVRAAVQAMSSPTAATFPCRHVASDKTRRIDKARQKMPGKQHTFADLRLGEKTYTLSESIARGAEKKCHYARMQAGSDLVAMLEFRVGRKQHDPQGPDRLHDGAKTRVVGAKKALEEMTASERYEHCIATFYARRGLVGFVEGAAINLERLRGQAHAMPLAYGIDEAKHKLYVVTRLSAGSGESLLRGLANQSPAPARKRIRSAVAASFCAQMGWQLHGLHTEAHVLHGDVKAANALVGTNGSIQLADFGTAASVDKKGNSKHHGWAGTLCAPEMLTASLEMLRNEGKLGGLTALAPLSTRVDVYTLAAETLQLLHGPSLGGSSFFHRPRAKSAWPPQQRSIEATRITMQKLDQLKAIDQVAALCQAWAWPAARLPSSGNDRVDAFLRQCYATDPRLTLAMLSALRISPHARGDALCLAKRAAVSFANDQAFTTYTQALAQPLQQQQQRQQLVLEEMRGYEQLPRKQAG